MRFRWLIFLAIAVLAGRVASPWAAQITFSEDDKKHFGYINIFGKIVPTDAADFRRMALWLISRGDTIFKVNVCTIGGDVAAAESIGDQIKTLGARTSGPNTFINLPPGNVQCWLDGQYQIPIVLSKNTQTGEGDFNVDCASACFLIWASGVTREGNIIGVHRFIFDKAMYGALSAEAARAAYNAEMESYRQFLLKRDVPYTILDRLFATESTSMYYLSKDELALMQSTPYLEELIRARCGESHDIVQYDENGNWLSTTQDINHVYCVQSVLTEIQTAGVKAYLAESQGSPPDVAPVQPVLPPAVTEPAPPPGAMPYAPTPEPGPAQPVVGPAPSQPTEPPQERMDGWQLNDSSMYCILLGKQSGRCYYDQPRPGLVAVGVQHGTLWFDGGLKGNVVLGTAYVFSRLCGPLGYSVTGTISRGREAAVTFFGKAPTVDAACHVVGYKDVVDVLRHPGPFGNTLREPIPSTPASVASASSFWDMIGSTVYLVKSGDERKFFYQSPISELLDAGVTSGTLLFQGKIDRDAYMGLAYTFKRNCPKMGFTVSGTFSPDEKELVLSGLKPIRDNTCRVKRQYRVQIVFKFIRSANAEGTPE